MRMRTPVARLVTRLQGEGDGLIIGSLLKSGQGLLEPNTVYELGECMLSGDLILRKVGKSLVAVSGETCDSSPLNVHWAMDLSNILAHAGKYLMLSKEEYKSLE